VIDYLAYSAPLAVFWLTLAGANYVCIALGSAINRRFALERGGPEEKALDVAHGAIFVLAGLILGFTFSYASARFDARRLLVVDEANAIGTTYLRASYLPAGAADRFRAVLRDYAQARLATYSLLPDPAASQATERKSIELQDVLWSAVLTAARNDPRNVQLGLLTQTLNETIDISAKQSAALRNHVPTAMLGLVFVVSLVSMILVGVHFARMREPQVFLGIVVALLLATVVTAIVDLDRPQAGLVVVNLRPLETQLQQMR
jgi:hypothetical protein